MKRGSSLLSSFNSSLTVGTLDSAVSNMQLIENSLICYINYPMSPLLNRLNLIRLENLDLVVTAVPDREGRQFAVEVRRSVS